MKPGLVYYYKTYFWGTMVYPLSFTTLGLIQQKMKKEEVVLTVLKSEFAKKGPVLKFYLYQLL